MKHQLKPQSVPYRNIFAHTVKKGDVLNVNTGYRPLDDEDCEVLKVREIKGLFGDNQIEFQIQTGHGIDNYCVGENEKVSVVF